MPPAARLDALHPAEHDEGVDQRDAERRPQRQTEEAEPGEEDEGAAQQRDEQPVAAGGVEAEDAVARRTARRLDLPDRHADQAEDDEAEERRGLPRPGHP